MFKRKIENVLNEYYQNEDAAILLIDGARQIGKTFIIRETAKRVFPNYVEINLQDDFDGEKVFADISTTQDFYLQLSILGNHLGTNKDTIIFLDEIQVYPHLISLLKPLKTDNKYRYIASGSLLGLTMRHIFIPMGSIQEVKMYPMDFEEFLWAKGVGTNVIEYLKDHFQRRISISEGVHKSLLRCFQEYLLSGGLPDAVSAFLNQDISKMRQVQSLTFTYYMDDASKYDSANSLKIRRIYELLKSYMENKAHRIRYRDIEGNGHATFDRYQDEFDYLVDSGCALPVQAISDPHFPLVESISKNLIKLYYNDVGLLTNILYKGNIQAVLNADSGVNLGSVYETAAAMELRAHGHDLYYFDNKKQGEVDFLINDYDKLTALPIEIKSGRNYYAYRALPKLVDKKGKYRLKQGFIFSNKNEIATVDDITTFPIYLIMFI